MPLTREYVMAKIEVWLINIDILSDVTSNPEVILMLMQQDDEADVALSYWLSGQSVTKPKNSHYDEKD